MPMNCEICLGKGEIVAATVKITYGMVKKTCHKLAVCPDCSKTISDGPLKAALATGIAHYGIEPCL